MLSPLVPCSARMAVIAFFTPVFFGRAATLVAWGLVGLSLLILAVAGALVNKPASHGEKTAFIMELPLYHGPNPRTIGTSGQNNTRGVPASKAGSLILFTSMVVWALSTLPGHGIEQSVPRHLRPRAGAGRRADGAGPMATDRGADHQLLRQGKHHRHARRAVRRRPTAGTLAAQVAFVMTYPARLAFLVVQMLFIPCLATVATIRATRSWGWTLLSIGMMLAISLGAGILVYQLVVRL